jgi:alcohol dehydrogenase
MTLTGSSPQFAATGRLGNLGLLRLPRTILFGAGQRAAVGPLVREMGQTALICTDERLGGAPELADMVSLLEAAGVTVDIFAETEPELPVAGVLSCVARLRGRRPDAVIGFGGGSCLDMAKVVSLLLAHGGAPQDYYGEFAVPGPTLPVVAIPTTAGTGSEVTPVAVIADPKRAMKVGISSPHLIPAAAICDPELTASCPVRLTAATGADALTHLIEAFTAVRRPPAASSATDRVFIGKSAFTDWVALGGLEQIGRSLVTAYREPADAVAREQTMLGALAGGIALGTAGTAAAHALQYPLGALTHTPHGVGVGALLPYVMRFNLHARVDEFAQIGRALGAPAEPDPVAAALAAIITVDELLDAIGIPGNLADLGLPASAVGQVAQLGLGAARLVDNNPRRIDLPAAQSIVQAAYEGDRALPTAAQVRTMLASPQ